MELKVAFLDCRGHGDCVVITFEEKGKPACIVVDGGEFTSSAEALSDYLESQNVKTINLMVGTHIDQDHINGLKIFVQDQVKKRDRQESYIEVNEFWGSMPSEEFVTNISPTSESDIFKSSDSLSWQQYVIQSVGQNDDLIEALQELAATIRYPAYDSIPQMPFEDIKIELLGPDTQIPADKIISKALGLPSILDVNDPIKTLEDLENAITSGFEKMAEEAKRNANNQSIVFRLSSAVGDAEAKKWTFLFTGDAEEEAWDEMVNNTEVVPCLKARVLKIPHHGSSQNGITDDGADKVKPEHSVNSVGQKHGLPDKETLKLLQDLGSDILCMQRNQSSSHNSACYDVPATVCPAKGKSKDIYFTVNTDTGKSSITPKNRECKHSW
ncbi:MAG: hypothetical protein KAV87_44650 [Desulfobacteraceae bacterium]|nr:hypothetical protein [Desulfobacteraceae bacterium]